MNAGNTAAPQPGEVLVRAENVSKKFCRSLKKSLWYGIKDMGYELTGTASHSDQLRPQEFWAVNDVSFELKRGECLGFIGHNGAGKTTLLKMLNGLIKPDVGRIEMTGNVGALIALGAGFNPILSGRENVYVNASVLGIKGREIEEKLDEIIEFADVGDFIDSPVQSYSSGMQVRLGFAVATALKPDVLILDEILAVGDAAFRHKCYHRISKIMQSSAVIFVSHSMDYVGQIASFVGLMDKGRIELFEDTYAGISAYSESNALRAAQQQEGDGGIRETYAPVSSFEIRLDKSRVSYGESLSVEIEMVLDEVIDDCNLSFVAVNQNEQPVMAWHTSQLSEPVRLDSGRQRIRFSIDPVLLHPGGYTWNFNIARGGSIEHVVWFVRAGSFVVDGLGRPICNIPYLPQINSIEKMPI